MQEMVGAVKNVTMFLLLASLLIHLFADTEFKKYFLYAAGLMVMAIFLTPVLSFFSEKADLGEFLKQGVEDISQAENFNQLEGFRGEGISQGNFDQMEGVWGDDISQENIFQKMTEGE